MNADLRKHFFTICIGEHEVGTKVRVYRVSRLAYGGTSYLSGLS